MNSKVKFEAKLAKVEHRRAGTDEFVEVPLNRWHAVRLWVRRLFR